MHECRWRMEDNLQELLLSLYHMVLGIELGSAELGNNHPLSDEPSCQPRIQASTPSWCYIPVHQLIV